MKKNWKRGIACFLVLALIAVLGVGCGDDEEEGEVTITIGMLTDLTAAAAPSVVPLYYAMQDVFRYYNDEGLIPGVELKAAAYDGHLDPARDVPGYEWLRERGAELIIAVLPYQGPTLKPFAEKDKVMIISFSNNEIMRVPPGWVFCYSPSFSGQVRTLLKWISENHWDWETNGPAKLGLFRWADPGTIELLDTMTEWCDAHPDQWDFVAQISPPMGTMAFGAADLAPFEDCDYILPFAAPAPFFVKAFRDKNYETTWICDSSLASTKGFLVEMVGWDTVDGTLTCEIEYWWDEDVETINLAKEVLQRYRPGEAEDIIAMGSGYKGVFTMMRGIVQIVQAAIEAVGAENVDGQAYYDAALTTEIQFEGYEALSFGERRDCYNYVKMYEWSKDTDGLVSLSDWIPILLEE